MATRVHFLCVVVLLGLVGQGFCSSFAFAPQDSTSLCPLSTIRISQRLTGRKVGNFPERMVTINNICGCAQFNVRLACKGFTSAEKIDPINLKKSADLCLVNNGNPIITPVGFTYAAASAYPFAVVSTEVAC